MSRRLLLPLFLVASCGDSDHLAPAESCRTPDCTTPNTSTGSGASNGTGASAGAAAGETGDAGQRSVALSVVRYDSETFDQTSPYEDSAGIVLEGVSGTLQANWPGSGSIEVADAAPEAFVLVSPTDESADALPTVLRLPASLPDTLAMPLVRATSVQAILAVSGLPIEQVPGRAQLVLRVRDGELGTPLAGVRVAEASAEAVLYAAGGVFSDAVSETDTSGLAVLVNVAADSWPGKLGSVTLSGAVLGSTPVRAVADAVSVLEARVAR